MDQYVIRTRLRLWQIPIDQDFWRSHPLDVDGFHPSALPFARLSPVRIAVVVKACVWSRGYARGQPVTPYSHQCSTSAAAWSASYRGAPQVGQGLGQEQLESSRHPGVLAPASSAARAHRQEHAAASTASE